MTTCLIALLVSFVAAVLATSAVRRLAVAAGVLDRPDGYRKNHRVAIPRLGGIAIFVAFLTPLLAIYAFNPYVLSVIVAGHEREALGCILGGGLALAIGVVDDFRDLRPRTKLWLQLLPALVAYWAGCRIDAISLPLLGSVSLGWLALPVTVFWFLACMNAVNFLDGLDGLAAGVALFVTLTLLLVGIMFHNVASVILMACLGGAILGFLVFNFHPAKIFLGDSGSLLLGFLVAAMSLSATRKAEAAIALLIPIVALGVPIMDTTLAVCRRWYKHFPIEMADRGHIHHVLVNMGWSHRRAVLLLYALCVAFGLFAVLITLERSEVTLLVLVALAVMGFVCIRVFGRLDLSDVLIDMAAMRKARHHKREAAALVDRAAQSLRNATSTSEIWDRCAMAFAALNLDSASLVLNHGPTMDWVKAGGAGEMGDLPDYDYWSARLGVRQGNQVQGHLDVCKVVSPQPVPPDTIWLIGKLVGSLGAELGRVSPLGEQLQPAPPAQTIPRPFLEVTG